MAANASDRSTQDWLQQKKDRTRQVLDLTAKALTTGRLGRQRWKRKRMKLQSEEHEVVEQIQENIVFHDSDMGPMEDMGTFSGGSYDHDADTTAGLGEFLKRPVRIVTYTWIPGSGFFQAMNPWALYFNNAPIKNKLQNYGKIKCRLHLKFMLNASPFHYGAIRACYYPLNDERSTLVGLADLIPGSQTPGVWLTPSTMDTAEMVLPFLWPHNWLEITQLAQFTNMGRMNLNEYITLQSANGATSNATIAVYAWAEDVEVMGPTTVGALQGDEYETAKGTVSGPATAVAKVASRYNNVPIIGDFARATEIGARSVASIARLFGYSNPPVIDDVMPMQPKSFHAFANSETRMPIDKLCLDPKNEVTVSSKVAGVDEQDPLVLSTILGHESFIDSFTWTSATSTDTLLWSAIVNPHYAYLANGFRGLPPVTYFSPNFRYWRGSMIYTFRFIKTQFHRGRAFISFDPNGDITGTSDTETTTFTRVIDLEHEDEVTFVVPYKATSPLLRVPDITTWPLTYSASTSPAYTYDSAFHNGTLTMRVQTLLSGPTTVSTIGVMVFVKAGPDFTYSAPTGIPFQVTTRDPLGVIQSSETITQEKVDMDVHVASITTGEVIASLRPLMHRTHYSTTQFAGTVPYTTLGHIVTKNDFHRVPPGYGRATVTGGGYQNANSAAPYSFNFAHNNIIDWALNCFVGYRGSMNLHVNPIVGGPNVRNLSSLSISRYPGAVRGSAAGNTNAGQQQNPITGTNAVASYSRLTVADQPRTGDGTTVTNPSTQAAISANLPQYWPLRFYQAFQTKRDLDPKGPTAIYDHFRVRTAFANTISSATASDYPALEVYASAGVDFAPVFFLCTPRVFVTVVPNASDAVGP